MTSQEIFTFIKANQLMLGLVVSAIVTTMPELLPHWKEFPQWCWTWVRDASRTFMNFRRPASVPDPKIDTK